MTTTVTAPWKPWAVSSTTTAAGNCRVINRYWVSNDEYSQIAPLNEKGDHGLFFQIVLKGLGGLTGAKVESFLDKGIEGYREREDKAF